MRRSDREIKSTEEILAVLQRCDVIRLGLNTPDYPYVVPLNFGIEAEGESLTIWCHCAPVGLKLDLIRSDPRVGFEADCRHKIILNEDACNSSMQYESVIGCGKISICGGEDEKLRGLSAIMRHYEPGKKFSFAQASVDAVCVLRLDVMQITGKRRL